jgi:phosphohistidine phosphatase SixA
MKSLIIARHGASYGRDLSHRGYIQMKNLSNALASNYPPSLNDISVLSSPAPRSDLSAKLISKKYGKQNVEFLDELWDDLDRPSYIAVVDLMKIFDNVIKKFDDRDIVVLVTHRNLTENFPKYFVRLLNGQNLDFKPLNNGEAYMFKNMGNQKWERLPDGEIIYRSKNVFY